MKKLLENVMVKNGWENDSGFDWIIKKQEMVRQMTIKQKKEEAETDRTRGESGGDR